MKQDGKFDTYWGRTKHQGYPLPPNSNSLPLAAAPSDRAKIFGVPHAFFTDLAYSDRNGTVIVPIAYHGCCPIDPASGVARSLNPSGRSDWGPCLPVSTQPAGMAEQTGTKYNASLVRTARGLMMGQCDAEMSSAVCSAWHGHRLT